MKKKIIIIAIIVLILVIGIASSIIWYKSQIKAVTEAGEEIELEIVQGSSTQKIIEQLKEKNLIKNELAAKIYIKLNEVNKLQAGKYVLKNDQNLEEILAKISSGEIKDETISITFLEGKNMRWIAEKIAENTNNTKQDVFDLLEDDEYIKSLIDEYWFLEDEVTNKDIYYPLEGYLYPETYTFKNEDVTVKEIFKLLLDQTDKVLTEYKAQIKKSGCTVHQILTVASIIELECKNEDDKAKVSSVIYNRINSNMSIGSDVTTYYAIKVDMGERDLYTKEINTYNPYNTRGPNMEGKLPVGPISTVSETSIKAALNPTKTDYLYFVADSNGKVYFGKTYQEHQENINNLKNQNLWYQYED